MKTFIKALLFLCFASVTAFAQIEPAKLGVSGHNHLALQVKDLPTSAKFYRDVIGLKPLEVPDNLKAIRAWFSIGNGQQIHLLAGRTQPIFHDKDGSHIALFVDSIDKSEQYLKEQHLKYHKQTRFDGVTQIYFPDPDGYLIELNEAKKTPN